MSIDRILLEATVLLLKERVALCIMETGAHFATYVIEALPGFGSTSLNSATARLAMTGDKLIAYASFEEEDALQFARRTCRPGLSNIAGLNSCRPKLTLAANEALRDWGRFRE
ncbi:aspartate 1-decarboxylase [Bradyrhizobium sp. UFLA06-06]